MRLFIALDLGEDIKKELSRIQGELPEFKGKKTEIENLHLTLKFLGEIEEDKLERIRNSLREIKMNPFKISLGQVGVFSPSLIKIIWVQILGAEDLQREIDRRLTGIFNKEERFMSHVTIVRVKKIDDKKGFIEKLKTIKVKWIEFQVDRFSLKKSTLAPQGAKYEDVEVFNLI